MHSLWLAVHEDWTVGGIEAGGGSHRVVKKMLADCFHLVCFWNQSCMKDVSDLTSGWFHRIIILPTNRRTLLDNRTALAQKKIAQSLGAQRFWRSETCRGTTGLIHTQEVTGSSPVVSTKPLETSVSEGFLLFFPTNTKTHHGNYLISTVAISVFLGYNPLWKK